MNNEIKYVSPFKRFCITVGNLPTAYLESMSYYEGLTYLVNYLSNNVIPALNNNSAVVEELQEQFTILKNYVDNYFENLDVQEEINNKLDEMAESGTLNNMVVEYLQNLPAVFAFDNVNEMKNATGLIDGSIVQTLGYNSLNDGGKALYKIREKIESDIIDNVKIIQIGEDDLIAELIMLKANPEIYGAYGDGIHDDTTAIQNMINENDICEMNKTYLITNPILISGSRKIINCNGKIVTDINEAAIKIQDLQNSNLFFNYIENSNTNGNCINLNANETNYNQYNKITFNELKAGTSGKCIHFTTANGRWCNENTFIGGRCRTGNWAVYADDTSNSSVSYSCIEGNSFDHIGIEGTTNGFYLGRCWNTTISQPRYAESSHFITTIGKCLNLIINNKHNANLPKFILSNETEGLMLGGTITDGHIDYDIGAQIYPIHAGRITGLNHKLYLNISAGLVAETEGIYDMTSVSFPSAPTYIMANFACNTIILPSYYGVINGINKIELALNETTSRTITIKKGNTTIAIFGNEIPDYSRLVMEWDVQLGWYYYIVTRARTS